MTIHLVTFATEDYKRSAHLCVASAKRNGVDEAGIIESSGMPIKHYLMGIKREPAKNLKPVGVYAIF